MAQDNLEFKMIFDEISGYSAVEFLKAMLMFYPFPVACVQTDNGFEFTNLFFSEKPGAFDVALEHLGIRHKLIRVATPRNSGRLSDPTAPTSPFFMTTIDSSPSRTPIGNAPNTCAGATQDQDFATVGLPLLSSSCASLTSPLNGDILIDTVETPVLLRKNS